MFFPNFFLDESSLFAHTKRVVLGGPVPFEAFRRTQRWTTGELGVTFGKNGIVGLNAAICRTLKVDGKHAQFMFDRDRNLVGIKIVSQKTGDTYPLKTDSKGSHASLSGTSFLKNYGLYPEKTIAFTATYDEPSKTIIFDVSELVEKKASRNDVTGSKRQKATH
jgi:hypothetical protein